MRRAVEADYHEALKRLTSTALPRMRRVLVTGADGFIGSHLIEGLVRAGYDGARVRALQLLQFLGLAGPLRRRTCKGQFEVFAGDIRDPHGVRTAMQGCDAVLHLAALIAIPYSYHSPDTYVDTNIKGTLNVLQAARDLGVAARRAHVDQRGLRHGARSCRSPRSIRCRASRPTRPPRSARIRSRCRSHASFGTPVVIAAAVQYLRPAPVGARGDSDDHHADRQRPAADQAGRRASDARFQLRRPTPSQASSPRSRRDRAWSARSINFGSNFEISIGDTAQAIADGHGRDHRDRRPTSSGCARRRAKSSGSVASNDKAQRLLGWSPEYAGLDGFKRGLRRRSSGSRDPANLARYKADVYNL